MAEHARIALKQSVLKKLAGLDQDIQAGKWNQVSGTLQEVANAFQQLLAMQTGNAGVELPPTPDADEIAVNQEIKKSMQLVIAQIENWQKEQLAKISAAQNALANIGRFTITQNSAYYIDKSQ